MRYLVFMTLFLTTTILSAQPVKRNGHLKVDGTRLKNESNEVVMLRGMSFGWHNFWPRFYNKEAVKWLVDDWKCNVIRAAMGIEPKNGFLEDPEGSKKMIEAVVDAAISEGVYVIIDWHSHNIQLEEARSFFREMATKYGSHPNVIYEIFNEPDHESWQEVKKYSEELISTIRSVDPDNIILVGGPHWDQDIHIVADDPLLNQVNIMYTLHYYAATHKDDLRRKADYALLKGLPVFISESAGMEATGNGPLNMEEWQKWIDWSEKNKISWITWSVSDKDETCSVLKKSAASTGSWKQDDLKESGKRIREMLRKLNVEEENR